MPSINLMCLVLCLIICIVMYIATLPPSAERISNVLSLTLHLWWIAKYLSQTVTIIDIRLMMQMYMMKISMRTPKDDLIEKQKDCSDYSICNSYVKRYLHKLIYKRKTVQKAEWYRQHCSFIIKGNRRHTRKWWRNAWRVGIIYGAFYGKWKLKNTKSVWR